MAQVSTKRSAIFDYWKDKFIGKKGEIVSYDDLPSVRSEYYTPVVPDWGEIQCWACGKVHRHEEALQEKYANDEKMEEAKMYDDKDLNKFYQRCHIVPGACGGEDKPDNLFLLCPTCHVLSPDTVNVAAFFRWVLNRRSQHSFLGAPKQETILADINAELNVRGLPDFSDTVKCIYQSIEDPERFNNWAEYESIKQFLLPRTTSHAGEGVVYSTLIIGLTDYLEAKYNEMINDF